MMSGQGSGNVGCGVIKQTGALLFEQIRIWNLKLPLYLKNSFKNEFVHSIIPNIDFRWMQCSIGTLQPILRLNRKVNVTVNVTDIKRLPKHIVTIRLQGKIMIRSHIWQTEPKQLWLPPLESLKIMDGE